MPLRNLYFFLEHWFDPPPLLKKLLNLKFWTSLNTVNNSAVLPPSLMVFSDIQNNGILYYLCTSFTPYYLKLFYKQESMLMLISPLMQLFFPSRRQEVH